MPHHLTRCVPAVLFASVLTLGLVGVVDAQVANPSVTPTPNALQSPVDQSSVTVTGGKEYVARIEAIVTGGKKIPRVSLEEARIIRTDGTMEPIVVNAELRKDDSVETSSHTYVAIVFDEDRLEDDDQVIIYPNSKVTVGSIWSWWGKTLNRVRGYFGAGSDTVAGASRGTEFIVSVCKNTRSDDWCKDQTGNQLSDGTRLTTLDETVDAVPINIDIYVDPGSPPLQGDSITVRRKPLNFFERILPYLRPKKFHFYEIGSRHLRLPPWLSFSPRSIWLKPGQSAKFVPKIENTKDLGDIMETIPITVECTSADCDDSNPDAWFYPSRTSTLFMVVRVGRPVRMEKNWELRVSNGSVNAEIRLPRTEELRRTIEETSEVIVNMQPVDLVEHVVPNFATSWERNRVFKEARLHALLTESREAYEALGKVNLDWGRGAKALQAFEKASGRSYDWGSPSFIAAVAEAYRLTQDFSEAQNKIALALSRISRDTDAAFRVYAVQGNIYLDLALSAVRKYEANPTDDNLTEAQQRLDRARKSYAEAALVPATKDLDRSIVLTNLGEVEILEARILLLRKAPLEKLTTMVDKAIADYVKATTVNSEYPYAYLGQGYAHLTKARIADLQNDAEVRRKSNEAAVRSFTQALTFDSNLRDALIGRAIANFNLGMTNESKRDFSQAVELRPSTAERVLVPDVIGKDTALAVRIILNAGLVPQLDGRGEIVQGQEPKSITRVRPDSKVTLQLGPGTKKVQKD